MKLEVYNEKMESKNTLYFKLLITQGHKISLVTVDKKGHIKSMGYILSISAKGLHLNTSVSKELGLPLGKNSRIVINS